MVKETISVIIPAYKSAKTIGETVDSLLSQTRLPDEIIIVDDCGPDNLVEALGDRIDKVNLIRHDINKGVGGARNTGFQASTGDLVSFLDADDVFFPEFLEVAVKVLAENPEAELCFGGFHSAYDYQFEIIENRSIPAEPNVQIYEPEELLKAYLADSTSPLINFGIAKRSAINKISGGKPVFDESIKLTGDFQYLARLFAYCRLAFITNPCGIWRLRPDSMSYDQLAVWESREDSLISLLHNGVLSGVSRKSLQLVKENRRATVRYCAKLLARSGNRLRAVLLLAKEFFSSPSMKTLALLVLIGLNLQYRKSEVKSGYWRGSNIQ